MTEDAQEQPDVEPVPEPPVEQQTHQPGGDAPDQDEPRPDDEPEPNG